MIPLLLACSSGSSPAVPSAAPTGPTCDEVCEHLTACLEKSGSQKLRQVDCRDRCREQSLSADARTCWLKAECNKANGLVGFVYPEEGNCPATSGPPTCNTVCERVQRCNPQFDDFGKDLARQALGECMHQCGEDGMPADAVACWMNTPCTEMMNPGLIPEPTNCPAAGRNPNP